MNGAISHEHTNCLTMQVCVMMSAVASPTGLASGAHIKGKGAVPGGVGEEGGCAKLRRLRL